MCFIDWHFCKMILVETTNTTMEEEAKLFVRKVSKLESVWDKLDEINYKGKSTTIKHLRQKGATISSCVKKEGSLNAGGKFEWVDSMLTKVNILFTMFLN